MRRLKLYTLLFGAGLALLLSGRGPHAQPAGPRVGYVELEGSVNPGSADYLVRAIGAARDRGDAALLVRLDTPGGLVESTREIVKAQLGSALPVIVWVGPAGARAGSAGVFITMAAHVAAMAPATNIGAAHPVAMGPGGGEQKPDETMNEKVTNDLAAWAQGIAKERGRNGDWAAEAVRKSVSVPAEKALELKVVDLLAPDVQTLLQQIDGRKVQTAGGPVTLATAHAQLSRLPMTVRERVLDFLGDPNIAFLFIGLGILGILAELYHPGTLIPGVVGAISLAIGFVATRTLPVRLGAIVLLLVGAALIAAEFYVTSWGLLAVGGIICFGLGALLLIDPSNPDYLVDRGWGIDWLTVAPILLVVGGTLALVVWKVTASRLARPTTGVDGLLAEVGVVVEEVGPSAGTIRVHGELWAARAAAPIAKGVRVRITRLDGLEATVAPLE